MASIPAQPSRPGRPTVRARARAVVQTAAPVTRVRGPRRVGCSTVSTASTVTSTTNPRPATTAATAGTATPGVRNGPVPGAARPHDDCPRLVTRFTATAITTVPN